MLIPQFFGRVIDGTCRLWSELCGEAGACSLYDIVDLRMKLSVYTVSFNLIGLLFLIAAMFVVRREERKRPQNIISDPLTT